MKDQPAPRSSLKRKSGRPATPKRPPAHPKPLAHSERRKAALREALAEPGSEMTPGEIYAMLQKAGLAMSSSHQAVDAYPAIMVTHGVLEVSRQDGRKRWYRLAGAGKAGSPEVDASSPTPAHPRTEGDAPLEGVNELEINRPMLEALCGPAEDSAPAEKPVAFCQRVFALLAEQGPMDSRAIAEAVHPSFMTEAPIDTVLRHVRNALGQLKRNGQVTPIVMDLLGKRSAGRQPDVFQAVGVLPRADHSQDTKRGASSSTPEALDKIAVRVDEWEVLGAIIDDLVAAGRVDGEPSPRRRSEHKKATVIQVAVRALLKDLEQVTGTPEFELIQQAAQLTRERDQARREAEREAAKARAAESAAAAVTEKCDDAVRKLRTLYGYIMGVDDGEIPLLTGPMGSGDFNEAAQVAAGTASVLRNILGRIDIGMTFSVEGLEKAQAAFETWLQRQLRALKHRDEEVEISNRAALHYQKLVTRLFECIDPSEREIAKVAEDLGQVIAILGLVRRRGESHAEVITRVLSDLNNEKQNHSLTQKQLFVTRQTKEEHETRIAQLSSQCSAMRVDRDSAYEANRVLQRSIDGRLCATIAPMVSVSLKTPNPGDSVAHRVAAVFNSLKDLAEELGTTLSDAPAAALDRLEALKAQVTVLQANIADEQATSSRFAAALKDAAWPRPSRLVRTVRRAVEAVEVVTGLGR